MKSIDYTDQSPIETFNKGRDKIQAERKEYSKGRTHRLKGGSVGCLLPDGKVLGVSLFQSIARYIGLEMPVSKTSLDTFSGGFLSEFDWLEKFKAANMPYKCEGDIPIRDEIAGRPLTGHPDIVPGVYDGETFTPSYGIELKAVLSVGTAAKVFLHQQPKDENFCQSCSYMYRMGVPWVLVYSNNTHFKTDSFIKRDFKGVDKILPQKV